MAQRVELDDEEESSMCVMGPSSSPGRDSHAELRRAKRWIDQAVMLDDIAQNGRREDGSMEFSGDGARW